MASAIDDTKPTAGNALTGDVRANFTTAKNEITTLQNAITNVENKSFAVGIPAATVAAANKVTPVSADEFMLVDSAAANIIKNLTYAQLLAAVKNGLMYLFDTRQDFRLSLTSGSPAPSADVTGATTIYCTPYCGNNIALYDGTKWILDTSVEFSIALGTLTSGLPYDVFCYDAAGVPTLAILAWTSSTARATALAYQDGILVKSGDATRRYLGTFVTTSTTQTEDSVTNRYLWNYYNRVHKYMERHESAATWTYTTATIRQANANAANQLNFVIGVVEDVVNAMLVATAQNTNTGVIVAAGVGLDSTTAIAADGITAPATTSIANGYVPLITPYVSYVSIGKHYLAWLEYSAATGTTTWTGTPTTTINAGIMGSLLG